ncbi:hypothetical protein BDR26DRAFT_862429, partial [Obelidium mucronatum]
THMTTSSSVTVSFTVTASAPIASPTAAILAVPLPVDSSSLSASSQAMSTFAPLSTQETSSPPITVLIGLAVAAFAVILLIVAVVLFRKRQSVQDIEQRHWKQHEATLANEGDFPSLSHRDLLIESSNDAQYVSAPPPSEGSDDSSETGSYSTESSGFNVNRTPGVAWPFDNDNGRTEAPVLGVQRADTAKSFVFVGEGTLARDQLYAKGSLASEANNKEDSDGSEIQRQGDAFTLNKVAVDLGATRVRSVKADLLN